VFLVAGLGNPGREHENDRHNVGFQVVDALGIGDFKVKFNALLARGQIAGRDVAVLKPQTYMNLSGDSVQPAAAFFKVDPADLIVVHDELDLPWSEVRLKLGGGHAGHNGVRNIIERLGTPDFVRARVGIGKPGPTRATRDWVLSSWEPGERAELPRVIERAAVAVRRVIESGAYAAMASVNTKVPGETKK
jgi:PTH1 family peptidyl-tRNA hydrolase